MSAAIRFTESRSKGGWCEIGVYRETELLAAISHPCAGADWFVYWPGWKPRSRFKTRKAAIEAVNAS